MYCWLTNTELWTAPWLMPWMRLIWQDILHKAHHRPPALRHTGQYFSTTLGDIVNSQITNKRHPDAKNVALNGPQKAHMYSIRPQPSRQKFDLSYKRVAGNSRSPPPGAWMITKALCRCGVTNKLSESVDLQIWNPNIRGINGYYATTAKPVLDATWCAEVQLQTAEFTKVHKPLQLVNVPAGMGV